MTAGFTAGEPLGGTNTARLKFHRYLDAAIAAPHPPAENLGTALFFLQPEYFGTTQVAQAVAAHASLIVGIDFLFWYCYGADRSEAERLATLERGLKLLESVPCPLVIGDLPDASGAIGIMLSAAQVPKAKTLAEANRRLREWAARRPQVTLIPLAELMSAAVANKPIIVRQHTLAKGQTRQLLQDDRLHPTPQGAAMLAVATLITLQSARPSIPANDLRWDLNEVYRLGLPR